MSQLLIINGHPHLNSFSAALSRAYEASARERTAVERIDVRDLRFDLVLHHGYAEEQPLEPDLVRAQEAILRASHVAWFFPCWWNGLPALLKGFIDRVFLPGYAFKYPQGGGIPHKLLKGRTARVVSSMDSPRLWQMLVNGSAMETSFVRSTLGFVGFSPVKTNIYYSAGKMSSEAREKALMEMRRVAEKDTAQLGRRVLAAAG